MVFVFLQASLYLSIFLWSKVGPSQKDSTSLGGGPVEEQSWWFLRPGGPLLLLAMGGGVDVARGRSSEAVIPQLLTGCVVVVVWCCPSEAVLLMLLTGGVVVVVWCCPSEAVLVVVVALSSLLPVPRMLAINAAR